MATQMGLRLSTPTLDWSKHKSKGSKPSGKTEAIPSLKPTIFDLIRWRALLLVFIVVVLIVASIRWPQPSDSTIHLFSSGDLVSAKTQCEDIRLPLQDSIFGSRNIILIPFGDLTAKLSQCIRRVDLLGSQIVTLSSSIKTATNGPRCIRFLVPPLQAEIGIAQNSVHEVLDYLARSITICDNLTSLVTVERATVQDDKDEIDSRTNSFHYVYVKIVSDAEYEQNKNIITEITERLGVLDEIAQGLQGVSSRISWERERYIRLQGDLASLLKETARTFRIWETEDGQSRWDSPCDVSDLKKLEQSFLDVILRAVEYNTESRAFSELYKMLQGGSDVYYSYLRARDWAESSFIDSRPWGSK